MFLKVMQDKKGSTPSGRSRLIPGALKLNKNLNRDLLRQRQMSLPEFEEADFRSVRQRQPKSSAKALGFAESPALQQNFLSPDLHYSQSVKALLKQH